MGARQNLAPNVIIKITTNKGNKMSNRFRIEIYDANKLNDLTIYSDQGVDREHLAEIVYSNIKQFNGTVRAYVYDNAKKKKIAALFLKDDIVEFAKSKSSNISKIVIN